MGKIIITLTDELEEKLRKFIKAKYGNKKGALSIVVEEAIKQFLNKEAKT